MSVAYLRELNVRTLLKFLVTGSYCTSSLPSSSFHFSLSPLSLSIKLREIDPTSCSQVDFDTHCSLFWRWLPNVMQSPLSYDRNADNGRRLPPERPLTEIHRCVGLRFSLPASARWECACGEVWKSAARKLLLPPKPSETSSHIQTQSPITARHSQVKPPVTSRLDPPSQPVTGKWSVQSHLDFIPHHNPSQPRENSSHIQTIPSHNRVQHPVTANEKFTSQLGETSRHIQVKSTVIARQHLLSQPCEIT